MESLSKMLEVKESLINVLNGKKLAYEWLYAAIVYINYTNLDNDVSVSVCLFYLILIHVFAIWLLNKVISLAFVNQISITNISH